MADSNDAQKVEDIEALVRRRDTSEAELGDALGKAAQVKREKDRGTISLIIALAYVGTLVAIFGYLLYRGISCNEDVFPNLIETLKIGVIPIITFVIGHYFGSSKN